MITDHPKFSVHIANSAAVWPDHWKIASYGPEIVICMERLFYIVAYIRCLQNLKISPKTFFKTTSWNEILAR